MIEPSVFDHVSIYPNPTKDNFTIILDDLPNVTVGIYSMSGQLVQEVQNVNSSKYELQTNFPAGIYSVMITSGKNQKVYKLIKY